MDVLIQSLVQANFAPERIIPRASMAQYTTFRVGGVADVLVNIASADEIPVALSAAKKVDVPVTIIGCGSNLLVRDGGIRGLVLRISSAMSAIRRASMREPTAVVPALPNGAWGVVGNFPVSSRLALIASPDGWGSRTPTPVCSVVHPVSRANDVTAMVTVRNTVVRT